MSERLNACLLKASSQGAAHKAGVVRGWHRAIALICWAVSVLILFVLSGAERIALSFAMLIAGECQWQIGQSHWRSFMLLRQQRLNAATALEKRHEH